MSEECGRGPALILFLGELEEFNGMSTRNFKWKRRIFVGGKNSLLLRSYLGVNAMLKSAG